jgi:hypothetical protein
MILRQGVEVRKYGSTEVRKYGSTEVRKYGSTEVRKYGSTEVRKYGSTEVLDKYRRLWVRHPVAVKTQNAWNLRGSEHGVNCI